MRELTELIFTLGNWGAPPWSMETRREIIDTFSAWAQMMEVEVRFEVYAETRGDHETAVMLLRMSDGGAPVQPVVRLVPRGDRLKRLAADGFHEVVFVVPVGRVSAGARFQPHGVLQAADFAARSAESAALQGLLPEIALEDITRARDEDVSALVEKVMASLRPRGLRPRWRLVDTLGLGRPFPGERRPYSLLSWARWMKKRFGIHDEEISVQASDTLGLALANTIAGIIPGGSTVSSLFGLGGGSGWAATEQVIINLWEEGDKRTRPEALLKLKSLLDPEDVRRDRHRPLSGALSLEAPAGTTPEKMERKARLFFPFDPSVETGSELEPLLTSLSGKAGLLHLIHHHNPDSHIDSDDRAVDEIYAGLVSQFNNGRQVPVCWDEVRPLVEMKGIMKSE